MQGLRSRCGIEGHVNNMGPVKRPSAVGVRIRVCVEAAVAVLQVSCFQVLSSAFVRGKNRKMSGRVILWAQKKLGPNWQSNGGDWRG